MYVLSRPRICCNAKSTAAFTCVSLEWKIFANVNVSYAYYNHIPYTLRGPGPVRLHSQGRHLPLITLLPGPIKLLLVLPGAGFFLALGLEETRTVN